MFRYDVIFDPITDKLAQRSPELLKTWRGSAYVTITNPLMHDSDEHGLPIGLLASSYKFLKESLWVSVSKTEL